MVKKPARPADPASGASPSMPAGTSFPTTAHPLLSWQRAVARTASGTLRQQSSAVEAVAHASLPSGLVRDAWLSAARMHAATGDRLVEMVDRWIAAVTAAAPSESGAPGDD